MAIFNVFFQAIDLMACKMRIFEYVESRMSLIAPNMSLIIGASIAAKLMGKYNDLQQSAPNIEGWEFVARLRYTKDVDKMELVSSPLGSRHYGDRTSGIFYETNQCSMYWCFTLEMLKSSIEPVQMAFSKQE